MLGSILELLAGMWGLEGFSFQWDGRKHGVAALALLVEVCRSVGGVPAEGAGTLSQGPAEEVAATLLTGADRGSPSGEDLTLLLVHAPVLSVPGGM